MRWGDGVDEGFLVEVPDTRESSTGGRSSKLVITFGQLFSGDYETRRRQDSEVVKRSGWMGVCRGKVDGLTDVEGRGEVTPRGTFVVDESTPTRFAPPPGPRTIPLATRIRSCLR